MAVSHGSSFALEGLALRENININNNGTFCDELAAEQDFGLLIAGSQVSVYFFVPSGVNVTDDLYICITR